MTTAPEPQGEIGGIHGDRANSPKTHLARSISHSRHTSDHELLPWTSAAPNQHLQFDRSAKTGDPSSSSSPQDIDTETDVDDETTDDELAMARPSMSKPTESRSNVPLLKEEHRGRHHGTTFARPTAESRTVSDASRRSSFRSKMPDYDSKRATRRKYIIASFFLVLSLISFTVQTQTAVFIQQELGWDKPYCML